MIRALSCSCFVLCLYFLPTQAIAAERGGVILPDTEIVDGSSLQLNGLGIRQATVFYIDVYVAGLYLEKKSTDENEVINSAQKKKLILRFVRDLGKDDLSEAWKKGFESNANGSYDKYEERVKTLSNWMKDVEDGQQLTMEFHPKKGVTISILGQSRGTIPGEDFSKILLSIFIGPSPPNKGLKEGLLGRG